MEAGSLKVVTGRVLHLRSPSSGLYQLLGHMSGTLVTTHLPLLHQQYHPNWIK